MFRPDPKPPLRGKKKKVYILKRTPLKRSGKRPRQVSDKRSAENAVYRIRAPLFLKGKKCPITGGKATQVHHKKGRKGYADKWARDNGITLFLDERFWLGVSAKGHQQIEDNPEWARENGYSLSRLAK